jgi:hypothetical protein
LEPFALALHVPTNLMSLIEFAVHAQLYGWRYALGFVLLLLCHEMGHYIAARQSRIIVGLPEFSHIDGVRGARRSRGIAAPAWLRALPDVWRYR